MLEMVGRYFGKKQIRNLKITVLIKRLKLISVALFYGIKNQQKCRFNLIFGVMDKIINLSSG